MENFVTRKTAQEWVPQEILVTPTDDVTKELFQPALERATTYKRAVGYFSFAWISRNASGLGSLASRGGKAKWIISPNISTEDWEALKRGTEYRSDVLETILAREAAELTHSLKSDTLNTIAWMVADGLLDFRIAIGTGDYANRDFHSKFGIFISEENPFLAFVGSMNETLGGMENHEVISIFSEHRGETARISRFNQLFDEIWEGQDEHYKIYELPEAIREKLIEARNDGRPYPTATKQLHFKSILRDYQDDAVTAWISNNHRGIMEMATGTGKTITALACIEKALADATHPKIILIVCPFMDLVEQWTEQIGHFNLPIIKAFESQKRWRPELSRLKSQLEYDIVKAGFIVTTYKTLSTGVIHDDLDWLTEKVMFIADECHTLGSPAAIQSMKDEYAWRLGLSATPVRHYDEDGTAALRDYFSGSVFQYGMQQAIENGFLVPYRYYPELVELTEEESEKYLQLTKRISKLTFIDDSDARESLKNLLIMRTRILNNAENKISWLKSHLEKKSPDSWRHTIVYAGDEIFTPVTSLVGQQLKIKQHEFTSRQARLVRQRILERFEATDLQILTAMKCLDEGIDIPPTRTAFFLASSQNPREFIQRRGRILRTSPGKKDADIFDAITVPSASFFNSRKDSTEWKAGRAALRSQMNRIYEFSSLALNRFEAEREILNFRILFDLPLQEEA